MINNLIHIFHLCKCNCNQILVYLKRFEILKKKIKHKNLYQKNLQKLGAGPHLIVEGRAERTPDDSANIKDIAKNKIFVKSIFTVLF